MSPAPPSEAPPRQVWGRLLDEVDAVLTAGLNVVDDRQRLLEDFIRTGRTAGDEEPEGWLTGLEAFLPRLREFQAVAERAAAGVADLDAALAAEEEALRDWLAGSVEARSRLEAWSGRGPAAG